MAGRNVFFLCLAAVGGLAAPSPAQEWPGGPVAPALYAGPAGGPVVPTAYGEPVAGGAAFPGPPYGGPAYGPPPGAAGGPGGAYFPPQAVERRHWWEMPCWKLFVAPPPITPPRGTTFKLEYLHWDIDNPGPVGIGFVDPADPDPFDVFLTDNGNFAQIATLNDIGLNDMSGARGTIAVPLMNYGSVELAGFGMRGTSETLNFSANPILASVPVTFAGVPGTISRVFDVSFDATYENDFWGASATYVFDALAPPGEGFKLRPHAGVRYLSFQEGLSAQGVFDNAGADVPFTSTINSTADNNIVGAALGVRAELVHRWFVLGVQPTIMPLAVNFADVTAGSSQFVSAADPAIERSEEFRSFGPVLDLSTYAKICITENLRVQVGFDGMWLSKVYRPGKTINYDVNVDAGGNPTTSNFRPERRTDQVTVEGLSVGIEYVY